ncbi:hypothetical protein AB0K48_44460 [Nonomuraea sp. NPDC055795]
MDVGTIRLLAAFGCGRVLNPTTARSQLLGAMVMAPGAPCWRPASAPARDAWPTPTSPSTCCPSTPTSPTSKCCSSANPTPQANPLGSRGIGEMGMTGTIDHATGKGVRDLPILMEKLL